MVTFEDRFWAKVMKGPDVDDCWIWTGAIADDGYGRFWTRQGDGRGIAVRPHRVAFELVTGTALESAVELMHDCDVPLCVHADADPAVTHLLAGTHTLNMRDRAEKGRHRNGHTTFGVRGLSRRVLAGRSRALREQVLTRGWDALAMAQIMSGHDADHPVLFELEPPVL